MTDTVSANAAPAAHGFSRGGLMLADGTFFEGAGFGAAGSAVGEVCFNTAMTGYQEILSDPSYAGQIVAFTFPHIGIVGTNDEDIETMTPAVRGLIVRADAEHPSNYRSLVALDRWMKKHNIPAVAGIDTRALTSLIREKGMPHGVVVNCGPSGECDRDALIAQAKSFAGLEGLDLAKDVTCTQTSKWDEMPWAWGEGYSKESEKSFRVTVGRLEDAGSRNRQEIVRLQACAPDEGPVDVGQLEQLGRVVGLHAASVQDAHRLGRLGIVSASDQLAKVGVDLLGLLGRGDFSRSDRPNRLIGNDRCRHLGR